MRRAFYLLSHLIGPAFFLNQSLSITRADLEPWNSDDHPASRVYLARVREYLLSIYKALGSVPRIVRKFCFSLITGGIPE